MNWLVLSAYSVTFLWDASSSPDVTGYKVYYGRASHNYTTVVNAGNVTSATINGLVEGVTYYFAVSAYTDLGLESDLSNEVNYTVPGYNGVPTNNVSSTNSIPVTNQFQVVVGSYNGLFYETNGVDISSAGFFNLKISKPLNRLPTFSAKILVDGETLIGTGTFNQQGEGFNTKPIQRKLSGKPALILSVHMPVDVDDQIVGTLTTVSNDWLAGMRGDRAVFSLTNPPPANSLGRYTLAIPGATDPAISPGGDGYGAVSMGDNGTIKLVGRLGDGMTWRQTVPLSKEGQWPLFAQAYKGTNKVYQGAVLGWLTLSNGLSGKVTWIKNGLPNDVYYPGGFFYDTVDILGSTYTNSALFNNRIIELTGGSNGVVTLSGGNLNASLNNNVTLSVLNKFTVATNNFGMKLLTISVNTGLLKTSFTHPDTGQIKVPVFGVVLQDQNQGRGYFNGANQSGSFLLQPR